jgi:Aspartyl protease
MKISVEDGLPYVTAALTFRGHTLSFDRVVVDTGSAGTIFTVDKTASAGLLPEPQDSVRRVWGVGGAEFVFAKQVDRLVAGELQVDDFEVEIGAMSYGFDIDGILGMDSLIQTGALIDLARLELRRV